MATRCWTIWKRKRTLAIQPSGDWEDLPK